MGMYDRMVFQIGKQLARSLEKPVRQYSFFSVNDLETLQQVLQPCDVLLVEGNLKISTAIKYLTQSTWSHSALYIGDAVQRGSGEPETLLEADISKGVITVPLSKYAHFNTRICRPVGLTEVDRSRVVQFAVERIGYRYDLKNLIDLARYLFPMSLVPVRWRRRMLALGSGDPTQAICSALIAQAFQSVGYPILPETEPVEGELSVARYAKAESMHIRHHSLFMPRDFDISPYFSIVKPTLEQGFDYQSIRWE